MSIAIDVILGILIVLGGFLGFKKGLIKSLVGFIGVITVVIVSWSLKTSVANFLIDKLPFFNFGGSLSGLSSINIMIYNVVAFFAIFLILYCILNLIVSLTGFVDTLLKLTVIWVIPSKIGGIIVGLCETWIFLYLGLFIAAQFSFSSSYVDQSKIGTFILDKTPFVHNVLGSAKQTAIEVNEIVMDVKDGEFENTDEANLRILQIEISYGMITKDKANELIQTGKIKFGTSKVMIS